MDRPIDRMYVEATLSGCFGVQCSLSGRSVGRGSQWTGGESVGETMVSDCLRTSNAPQEIATFMHI